MGKRDDETGPDDDDAPEGDDEACAPGEPLPLEIVRAFLARKETVAWVFARVRAKVPEPLVEEIAQDALARALRSAHTATDESALGAWTGTITDREIADAHKKRKRRGTFEGPMPEAPLPRDEAGEPVADDSVEAEEARAAFDPSYDPARDDVRVQGWLMCRYLEQAVRGNARDAETLSWMMAWADGDKTYEQIAAERRISPGAIAKRVFLFKEKYLPRYRRYRNGMIVLWLTVAVAVGVAVWLLLRPRAGAVEPIHADPDFKPLPSASAPPVAPPDRPFEPAGPTGSPEPAKPPLKPRP